MMNAHRLHKASKRRRCVYLKKMAFVFTTCVLIFGFVLFPGTSSADAHEFPNNPETSTIVQKCYKSIEIQPGDTLWKIAEEYMDEHYDSIYDYIHELKEINGLVSDNIQSEQFLTVAYYKVL